MRSLVAIIFLAIPLVVQAQDTPPAPPKGQTPSPQFEEKVEVVGITPIHGLGLDKHKVAANVQVLIGETISSSTLDVATALANQAASVHVNDAQAGSFQPDVQFRGFTGSPLLGASEGLAVYQDGVRINEAIRRHDQLGHVADVRHRKHEPDARLESAVRAECAWRCVVHSYQERLRVSRPSCECDNRLVRPGTRFRRGAEATASRSPITWRVHSLMKPAGAIFHRQRRAGCSPIWRGAGPLPG